MSKSWDGKERRQLENGNGRRHDDSVLPECKLRFEIQDRMVGRVDKIFYLIISLLLAFIGNEIFWRAIG